MRDREEKKTSNDRILVFNKKNWMGNIWWNFTVV